MPHSTFKFLYPLPGLLGSTGHELLIETHTYRGDVEIDKVWMSSGKNSEGKESFVDLLPVLQYEESKSNCSLLDELFEAARQHKKELHRESYANY